MTHLEISRDIGTSLDAGHRWEEYGEDAEEILVSPFTEPEIWLEVLGQRGCYNK